MLIPVGATPPTRPVVIAYVQNSDDLPAFADTIDYSKVTHLDIAFENPTTDEGDLSFNPVDDALVTKGHAHGVKVLVSIGGGSASGDRELIKRYFYLLSPTRRAGFVAKLTDYVVAHHFDGLDVDLEGPSINGDYGAFVRDLGAALKSRGKLLTAALSVGYGGDQVPSEAFQAFDFVNIMAYDATGPWAPNRPGQHSSMDLAKESAKYWLDRGLPKSKAVLGVPFYGYGFTQGKASEWSYKKLIAAYPDADKSDTAGMTIYYNGTATIQAKGKYIADQGLAGAMIWSLELDAPGEKSLLIALERGLQGKG